MNFRWSKRKKNTICYRTFHSNRKWRHWEVNCTNFTYANTHQLKIRMRFFPLLAQSAMFQWDVGFVVQLDEMIYCIWVSIVLCVCFQETLRCIDIFTSIYRLQTKNYDNFNYILISSLRFVFTCIEWRCGMFAIAFYLPHTIIIASH